MQKPPFPRELPRRRPRSCPEHGFSDTSFQFFAGITSHPCGFPCRSILLTRCFSKIPAFQSMVLSGVCRVDRAETRSALPISTVVRYTTTCLPVNHAAARALVPQALQVFHQLYSVDRGIRSVQDFLMNTSGTVPSDAYREALSWLYDRIELGLRGKTHFAWSGSSVC